MSSELNTNNNTWIIDSRASRYITGFRNQFEAFKEYCTKEVTTGDNSTYTVKEIETCSLQIKTG